MTTLTAPVIYSCIVPFVLLDIWVSVYQWVCFPVYGIAKVRCSDYIAIDRWKLGYLNLIEKANCDYCSYANGLIAYVREIASRTEQYWCPIRHARAIKGPHQRYRMFVDYGDARGYQRQQPVLRQELHEEKK